MNLQETAKLIAELDAKRTPGGWKLCAHLREHDANCPCDYRGGIWSGDGGKIVCEMGGTPLVDGVRFLPEADRATMLADAEFIGASSFAARALAEAMRRLKLAEQALQEYADADYKGVGFWDGIASPYILADEGDKAREALHEIRSEAEV